MNKGVYYYLTRYGKKDHTSFNYNTDEKIYLIFGKESTGIPKEILFTKTPSITSKCR